MSSLNYTILPATMPYIPPEGRSRVTVYISDALLIDDLAATPEQIAQNLLPYVEIGVQQLRARLQRGEGGEDAPDGLVDAQRTREAKSE